MKFLQKHWIYYFSHFFYIDGTKNAKASFWSLKKYKVFYTKFHSAQQNELYALIQVICLHPYPINIVFDSIHSVFVLKRYKNLHHKLQSTYYSTTLFFKLQSVIKNCTSPIYITHIRAHHTLKLQIKKFKKGNTQEHYSLPYLKQT